MTSSRDPIDLPIEGDPPQRRLNVDDLLVLSMRRQLLVAGNEIVQTRRVLSALRIALLVVAVLVVVDGILSSAAVRETVLRVADETSLLVRDTSLFVQDIANRETALPLQREAALTPAAPEPRDAEAPEAVPSKAELQKTELTKAEPPKAETPKTESQKTEPPASTPPLTELAAPPSVLPPPTKPATPEPVSALAPSAAEPLVPKPLIPRPSTPTIQAVDPPKSAPPTSEPAKPDAPTGEPLKPRPLTPRPTHSTPTAAIPEPSKGTSIETASAPAPSPSDAITSGAPATEPSPSDAAKPDAAEPDTAKTNADKTDVADAAAQDAGAAGPAPVVSTLTDSFLPSQTFSLTPPSLKTEALPSPPDPSDAEPASSDATSKPAAATPQQVAKADASATAKDPARDGDGTRPQGFTEAFQSAKRMLERRLTPEEKAEPTDPTYLDAITRIEGMYDPTRIGVFGSALRMSVRPGTMSMTNVFGDGWTRAVPDPNVHYRVQYQAETWLGPKRPQCENFWRFRPNYSLVSLEKLGPKDCKVLQAALERGGDRLTDDKITPAPLSVPTFAAPYPGGRMSAAELKAELEERIRAARERLWFKKIAPD